LRRFEKTTRLKLVDLNARFTRWMSQMIFKGAGIEEMVVTSLKRVTKASAFVSHRALD